MSLPRWAACGLIALAAYLVGLFLAPLLPGSAGPVIATVCNIVAIIALVAAVILLIMWLVGRGRART